MIDLDHAIEGIQSAVKVYNSANGNRPMETNAIKSLIRYSTAITDAIIKEGKAEELIEALREVIKYE